MAVTMLRTLTRQAEKLTTAKVSRTPMVYEISRPRTSMWFLISRPCPPNACAITRTIPRATRTPRAAPTNAATRSYASPSKMNIWTR
jgi:hypothetical protein